MTNLNEISKQFHERAKQKGFWDDKREIGTLLMLVVSELSEALEADRRFKHANIRSTDNLENGYTVLGHLNNAIKENNTDKFNELFIQKVKDTFEDELADTLIRLFDLIGYLGIDINSHIELKMKFNESRPHKHGKAY